MAAGASMLSLCPKSQSETPHVVSYDGLGGRRKESLIDGPRGEHAFAMPKKPIRDSSRRLL